MREFKSAVKDAAAEDEREVKIKALMEREENPLSRQDAEDEVDGEKVVVFKLDDREMRAYYPTGGQLTFMIASMGRGQSQESRFASIVNVMLECLRDEDQDYLEARLLTRGPNKIEMETVEEIFEGLVEEWFGDARPTQPSSGSAESQPSDGPNHAAYYQTDLLRLPGHRFLNLVYSWCIERVEHDKLDEWEADLVDLLPWQDSTSAAAEELESASFFAMQSRSQ